MVPIHMRYDPVPYAYEKVINNNLADSVVGTNRKDMPPRMAYASGS